MKKLWDAFIGVLSVWTKSPSLTIDVPLTWTGYRKRTNVLLLERLYFTDRSTIGELSIDADKVCYTLEDTCRANGIKIAGKTAIPAGRYEVIVNWSDRFKRPMPLLLNVPGFDGVRIHTGNTELDVAGCIALGMRHEEDRLFDSRKAWDLVWPVIRERCAKGKLWLSIIGGRSGV